MARVIGKYWKCDELTVNLQIKTNQQQENIEKALPGWMCVSYGYIPKTMEDLYIFQRRFESELDWAKFLNSEKTTDLIEMKEVQNG